MSNSCGCPLAAVPLRLPSMVRMFENRVPHMLDDDFTPHSALNIFVKDLGIVLGEAQGLAFPTPLASAAHQQFLAGAASGLGRQDDAAVVKVGAPWVHLGGSHSEKDARPPHCRSPLVTLPNDRT